LIKDMPPAKRTFYSKTHASLLHGELSMLKQYGKSLHERFSIFSVFGYAIILLKHSHFLSIYYTTRKHFCKAPSFDKYFNRREGARRTPYMAHTNNLVHGASLYQTVYISYHTHITHTQLCAMPLMDEPLPTKLPNISTTFVALRQDNLMKSSTCII